MLTTGLVIGLLVFVGRLALYLLIVPDNIRAWFEVSTRRMMLLELVNILTLQIAGSITGLFAASVASALGIITSMALVRIRRWRYPAWSRY